MNRKKQFMVLMLCVLALAIGLSAAQAQAQAQRKLCDPPQPQRAGASFIPSVTTYLGYKASLILSGLDEPAGIGVSPKGDKICFGTESDYSVWMYQNQELKLIQTTPNSPLGASYRGAFYWGDANGNISKAGDGLPPQYLASVPDTFISALDVDPQTGIIYFIAEHPTSVAYIAILKLLPGSSTPVALGYIFNSSWGLAVKGNFLYFTYYSSGQIYKESKNGGPLILVTGGLNGPTDICFDTKGNMIVAEWNGGSIARVKAGSLIIARIATGLANPYYLQLDASDNIYLTDNATGMLWKLKKH